MQRLRYWLLDRRTWTLLGFLALVMFLFVGVDQLLIAAGWAVAILVVVLGVWLATWIVRRVRAQRQSAQLEGTIASQAAGSPQAAGDDARQAQVQALQKRLRDAIATLKSSQLGESSGAAALYELPWYMVIGNPAAGKSSAIARSGLRFPLADGGAVAAQGIAGTRNCDWFFTTEGILLDTAGRYAVHEEDRKEWLDFLGLLKRHRPLAPINGIIVTVSVAELMGQRPEFAIDLARQLRQRVQELTERLEVFAPVYLMFTKADLIAGFVEYFEDRDPAERERIWGATLSYDAQGKLDAMEAFDREFDLLHEGLKASAIARMTLHRGQAMQPGVLSFPLEFQALKTPLRTFVATLFERNPYQFQPVFRGFYFTSSVQQGQASSRSDERVARRFALSQGGRRDLAEVHSSSGFFLKELFSKVIFADRQLVRQYSSRAKIRLRMATFAACVALLGLMLGGWTWSYLGNRQLVINTQADIDQAVKLQSSRIDLQSRLEALSLLQDRLAQLQAYREDRPWAIRLGLYQGDLIEDKLKQLYFDGVREVMLRPVASAIEAHLGQVNVHAARLKPLERTEGLLSAPGAVSPTATGEPRAISHYSAAQTDDVTDAYNALKTYVMLADRSRADPAHLSDQITRFWRGWLEVNRGTMPRDELLRSAERLIAFTIAQARDERFPEVANDLALLDQTRENLRRVITGMPARERVYAEIRARASTRFPPVSVAAMVREQDRAAIAGSHAISGAFSRAAWEGYVQDAIRHAANNELQTDDWVLRTSARDDLTLEGSPEQIEKALVEQYKREYVREWQRFVQGITIPDFADFDAAVTQMNRLGDTQDSPIALVLRRLHDETSWDNPGPVNEGISRYTRGAVEWFKQAVLRQAPAPINVNVNAPAGLGEIPLGPIGREFQGLTRIMISRDGSASLIDAYLASLSKVRTRLNQMKNQGDTGHLSRQLMQQTLEGSGSELADAQRLVDEQMLSGLGDSLKSTLRPLLVRPLIQSFAVLVPSTERELNRVWQAQVVDPFDSTLMPKYPFSGQARIEATPAEIAKVFGAQGAIAKYSEQTLGPLVVRRGDTITPRTWADIGVRLTPEFSANFAAWVAQAGEGGDGAGAAGVPQSVFQILPQPAPGLTEYTIEIDGQVLRYRNGASSWTNFVWPGPQGVPGARVSGLAFDGKAIEYFNEPGHFGFEKLLSSAQRRKLDGGVFELRWPHGSGTSVSVHLRIVSNAGSGAAAGRQAGLRGLRLPRAIAGLAPSEPAMAGLQPTAVERAQGATP